VRRLVAIADDLSGAAETAAALAQLSVVAMEAEGEVLVTLGMPDALPETRVLVIDLASRVASIEDVEAALVAALSAIPESALAFKKVDSQLRGNTGAELRVLARHRPLLLSPALPAIGRTMVDGRVRLTPATAGSKDASGPPTQGADVSAVDLFEGIPTTVLGLDVVRSPHDVLLARVSAGLDAGAVLILDAETDDDLTAIARVAQHLPHVLLAGSGGLAAALGRLEDKTQKRTETIPHDGRNTLVVVGTSEPGAKEQIEQLRLIGAEVREVDPLRPLESMAIDASHEVTVIVIGWGPVSKGSAPAIDDLSALLIGAARNRDLVLTGGETARTVLDLLSESQLHPLAEVRTGAVVSRTGSGRIVATRPGSFGGPDSLVELVTAVRGLRETQTRSNLRQTKPTTNKRMNQ
jgi:uncharacterized protein YgbK (DUF1537 family)